MEETAQRNVIIVRTTLLVRYRMENVMILGVPALYTSIRFVKVNFYHCVSALSATLIYNLYQGKGKTLHNYIDNLDALKPHQNIDIQWMSNNQLIWIFLYVSVILLRM